MAPRIKTSRQIEQLIVKLRDVDKLTYSAIGGQVAMGKSAVRKVYIRAKQPIGDERRGRPRKTSARTDRKLVRISKKNPKLSASEVAALANVTEIQVHTVRRRLSEVGLNGRIAAKKPFISEINKKKRRCQAVIKHKGCATKH
ncbi:hypothetical protein M3Y94_00286800 [Aphelenchoides besseyi]|nr:hypothetical protein M3Y94_00286800 [Aphelenchoides besseyi]